MILILVKLISNGNLQELMGFLDMMDFYLKIKYYVCLIDQCELIIS